MLTVCFFFIAHSVFSESEFLDSEDSESEYNDNSEYDDNPVYEDNSSYDNNSVYDDNSVFIINSIHFNIDGNTRPWALDSKIELFTGQTITGYSNLEDYIRHNTQLLVNERVLDNANIEAVIGQISTDNMYPVDIVINVKDTWNILVLPNPQYSTSTGISLIVSFRDFNFLGTMQPLWIDIGYERDVFNRNYYIFLLGSIIPFKAFNKNLNHNWNFILINEYQYRPNFEQKHYYRSSTGLNFQFNNQLQYTPYFSFSFNDISLGNTVGFGHSLALNRIDWIGNFRKGYSSSAGNNYLYSFYRAQLELHPWQTNYNIAASGHLLIKEDRLGLSANFKFRHWLYNHIYLEAGDVLRGIVDRDLHANLMFSFSFDFPIRVYNFISSEWSDNNKLRVLNFELHLNPFIDSAIYHHPQHQTSFSVRNILLSGGLEAIFFPEFFRSMVIRISLGYNLSKMFFNNPSSNYPFPAGYNSALARKYEIYLGAGFHY